MAKVNAECDRMGVSSKWPSREAIVKKIRKLEESWQRMPRSLMQIDIDSISDYVTRSDALPEREIPNKVNATKNTAESLAGVQLRTILATAHLDDAWLDKLAKWARYYEIGVRQSFFWSYWFDNILTPPRSNRNWRNFDLKTCAEMLGVLSILGWKDAVIYQGYLAHAALNNTYQLKLQYENEHRRAQAFMLRLFASWVGDADHAWPAYAYDEPIYEALLQHWRTPDPAALVPCLLAACDRHTHQAGRDTLTKFYDFSTEWDLGRVPVEILLLFRLREWEGLANPLLDHPLMAAPYHQLPPPQPVPPLDELMQGVVKRANEDWPGVYEEVLSLASLKASATQNGRI